jgi:hypothetical protein
MHRPGTVTVPSGMMERWKREGNYSPPKNKLVQIQREMKKTDTQIQTPTIQR